jgi:hypothetical protein
MISIFFFENRAVCEIMWKKYGRVRQATDDNIMWRMRFACWIAKATDTHSEYIILTNFRRQQWLRERASKLCCTYVACGVIDASWQQFFCGYPLVLWNRRIVRVLASIHQISLFWVAWTTSQSITWSAMAPLQYYVPIYAIAFQLLCLIHFALFTKFSIEAFLS